MELRKLKIIEDPSFYQYTTTEDLNMLNAIELTIALSVLRKEQRRLKDKVQVKGTYKKENADEIDKDNFRQVKSFRKKIEQILYDKQGFIPAQITKPMIEKLLLQNRKTIKKFEKKKR